MLTPEHVLCYVRDRAPELVLVELSMIGRFQVIEEVDVERLEDPTHIGGEYEADDVPGPTGLEEVDFYVGLVPVEEEEATVAR